MIALRWSGDLGDWVWNENQLCGPAFKPMDMEKLWAPAPLVDEENIPLDGVDGTEPVRRRKGQAVHVIEFQVGSKTNQAGTITHPSTAVGLWANYQELVSFIGDPTDWGGDTCSTTVTAPDGSQRAGPAQGFVGPPLGRADGATMRCTVTVTLTDGYLWFVV